MKSIRIATCFMDVAQLQYRLSGKVQADNGEPAAACMHGMSKTVQV